MDKAAPSPLKGKRIVITRAAEQSAGLQEQLSARGAKALAMPLVAFAPPDDPGQVDEALRNLRGFDWIFFTSQNAVRALQERGETIGLALSDAATGVRIAAVGPATAKSIEEAGLEVTYVSNGHQGTRLAEELGARLKGLKIFLPRSDKASQDLVEVLDDLGAETTEVITYRTVRPSKEETQSYRNALSGGVDAVLFFSPSVVNNLADLLGKDEFVKLAKKCAFTAIGPVTQRALTNQGVQQVLLSKDTTTADVVNTLEEYFAEAPRGVSTGAKHA